MQRCGSRRDDRLVTGATTFRAGRSDGGVDTDRFGEMFPMSARGTSPLDRADLPGMAEAGQPRISLGADAFQNAAQKIGSLCVVHAEIYMFVRTCEASALRWRLPVCHASHGNSSLTAAK